MAPVGSRHPGAGECWLGLQHLCSTSAAPEGGSHLNISRVFSRAHRTMQCLNILLSNAHFLGREKDHFNKNVQWPNLAVFLPCAAGLGFWYGGVSVVVRVTFQILSQIVNYISILVIIMSPFAVKSDPLSLYNLTWCHVTFLWHNWGHWDNLTSPCIHLIEPCWHTVNSCIFGKIYGQNLSGHKSDPGP